MAPERLQKVIAASGVASRRQAEVLIANGRVTVDGKVAVIGAQVDGAKAIIAVDGRVIGATAGRTYLLLHKPAGVTSTVRDRHADQTVLDYLPTALVPEGARLYPVGRLDLDSEGLLVLTNDCLLRHEPPNNRLAWTKRNNEGARPRALGHDCVVRVRPGGGLD